MLVRVLWHISPDERNEENYYYITDEQGSVRYVINKDAEVKNYYQYDAFGISITLEESEMELLKYKVKLCEEEKNSSKSRG